jgi:hypothetical protein
VLQDLRYAVRALRRSSGFAVTAIVTLALIVALGTSLFATVGVLPGGFVGLNNPWTPSECWFTFAQATGARYPRSSIAPIARRRADVSLDQPRWGRRRASSKGCRGSTD